MDEDFVIFISPFGVGVRVWIRSFEEVVEEEEDELEHLNLSDFKES